MTERRSAIVWDQQWEGEEGGITKGHEETTGSNGDVHYLDCGEGFMQIDMGQNLLSCMV